jgi:hypothetical protein
MPIRFRCVYCNQLLGIARRKAGNIVRCTSCQGQLIVPEPPPGEPDEPSGTAPGNGTDGGTAAGTADQPLFERNDFADLLQGFRENSPSAVAVEPSVTAPPPAAPAAFSFSSDEPAVKKPAAEAGVLLTRGRLTALCVGIALAVGLAFAGGLWLGLAMHAH